jgi:transcriptional regulator with XRE-family HTH domain
MAITSNVKKILNELSSVRVKKGFTELQIEEKLNLGKGWIIALENGLIEPPFDLILSITEILNIDLSKLIANVKLEVGQSLNRRIIAVPDNKGLILNFKYSAFDAKYFLKNASIESFNEVISEFRHSMNDNLTNKRDSVVKTFFKAIKLWPKANPSDIWSLIISRIYQDPYNHPATEVNGDFAQSWKRTSGWALEEIFVEHYKKELETNDILIGIFQKESKVELLKKMKLNYAVEPNKADVLLVNTKKGKYDCFGVVHVKASIAERRQNDQNFSMTLQNKNFFSPFMTMDCKSFPSEYPLNKGELGGNKEEKIDTRNDKRKEFEEEGYFSACFSYNTNTNPTLVGQKATSRIYKMNFQNSKDMFTQMTIQARNRLYGG